MSTRSPLQLIGQVDDRDEVIAQLQEEHRQLTDDLTASRAELLQVQRQNGRAIAKLRAQLSPLYRALQEVFGEMEVFGGEGDAPTSDSKNAKWDSIKQRLAPRLREAVDLLLLQGTMRRTQLASALKMDYSNCTKNVIGVLIRQGWVIDNNGSLSLKEL